MPESSPELESQDSTAKAQQNQEVTVETKADPAPAESKASMLDAVKTALKPEAPPASEPKDGPQPEPGELPKDDEPPSEDDEKPSEEERKNWSDRTQRRFKKLTSDVRSRDERIEALTGKAEEYDKIENYVRQAGLTENDVRLSLEFANNVRNDPVAAFNQLLPIMQHLERVVGHVVPPELQQRVRQGHLSPEDAVTISRSQAEAALTRQRLERQSQDYQRTSQLREAQNVLDGAVSEVERWEAREKAKDPDWHHKVGQVQELVELNVARRQQREPGWLPNAQEAVKISQDALAAINDRMKRFMPRPGEIRPVNTNSPAANRSTPEPKTTLEVIKGVLGKS